jgi:hypothetical protein
MTRGCATGDGFGRPQPQRRSPPPGMRLSTHLPGFPGGRFANGGASAG